MQIAEYMVFQVPQYYDLNGFWCLKPRVFQYLDRDPFNTDLDPPPIITSTNTFKTLPLWSGGHITCSEGGWGGDIIQ